MDEVKKAELEAEVRHRVACEEKAFYIVNNLIEKFITEDYLKECVSTSSILIVSFLPVFQCPLSSSQAIYLIDLKIKALSRFSVIFYCFSDIKNIHFVRMQYVSKF